jgi:hypothetical protein
MKKIFISSLFAMVFMYTSCEDATDITQPGESDSDTMFQTVEDLKFGLNYVYSAVSNNSQIALSSIWCDEVGIGFANGGQGLSSEYIFVMNSGSGYASSIWEGNYDLINFSNRLLSAAGRITPLASEEASYNDAIAQAKFLRAYGHFQLLTYFSTDLSDDNALGTILMDHVPSVADKLPRSTNGEVFALINEDLDFAFDNLIDQTNVKYITKRAINSLRARIALYRENYTEAQSYAEQVIAQVPLAARNQYLGIWQDANNNEVIFKLERTTGNSLIGGLWSSVNHTITGSPFYEIGRSLFNQLNSQDIRYSAIVQSTSVIDPNYASSLDFRNTDKLLIGKYPGSEGTPRLNDLKIFRSSEMYFIKAEAQINAGDLIGAATTLQLIREKRFLPASLPVMPVYGTAQDAWADVLKERRIELAFEGHRFIDLKRLGAKANATISRDPKDIEGLNISNIPGINDYRFTLPIPADETAINPNVQQNPQYTR